MTRGPSSSVLLYPFLWIPVEDEGETGLHLRRPGAKRPKIFDPGRPEICEALLKGTQAGRQ